MMYLCVSHVTHSMNKKTPKKIKKEIILLFVEVLKIGLNFV